MDPTPLARLSVVAMASEVLVDSVYFTTPDHHLSLPWTDDSFRRIAKASSQWSTGQVSGPVVVLWSQWTMINLRRGLYWLGIAELTERSRLWEGGARLLLRLQQQRPSEATSSSPRALGQESGGLLCGRRVLDRSSKLSGPQSLGDL